MKLANALILGVVAFAGCATVPPMPEPDRSWQSFSGQLQYVTPERSVIGEFVASRKDGDFRLDFSKGGAVPLIRVSRHGDYAVAEGTMARGRWQGVAGKAPAPLQGWVTEVPRAFAGLGSILSVTQNATGASGGSRRMEIKGAQPGERFVFVFNR